MLNPIKCEVGTLSTLNNLGWQVKAHPVNRGAFFSPDFIAEKQGLTVAIECKAGPGTITDIAILRNAEAHKRVMVAQSWASEKAKSLANRYAEELVRPDNFESHLRSLAQEASHKNALSRFWGRLRFLSYPS